ncbi:RNA 2'-phosphotransferase [Streptomyces sp. TRM 70361]|uniref:RNA 2'-phosphotransferase n=1 Tax=Streptomyces sp. TRM 70361 TaxID=3116553 RepID=UPI002E7B94FE|nr:RNA 2'-phosphotransferase [Streptomyces sp. TRM 70361]MEE1939610.1 RNA 2'-phosphotransferase [Streptomyces sp. TRM 70361]
MDEQRMKRVSKYLARHLRHDPGRIGLTLDARGWAAVPLLLEAAGRHGFRLTREELAEVVAGNGKRRFTLDADRDRIRADQGHTVAVDLGLPPAEPPAYLYHGTVGRNLAAIRRDGLRAMARHDVHLSPDRETAAAVGARRGRPVVLAVDTGAMHRDGHEFRVSANGVWLVARVPPEYLRLPG